MIYVSNKLQVPDSIPDYIRDLPFPECDSTEQFWYFFNTNKPNTELILVDTKTHKVYKAPVDIWRREDDYWFRHKIIGTNMIVTDYSGIKIYSNQLEILFQQNATEDCVFGFEYRDDQLIYWKCYESINYERSCLVNVRDQFIAVTTRLA